MTDSDEMKVSMDGLRANLCTDQQSLKELIDSEVIPALELLEQRGCALVIEELKSRLDTVNQNMNMLLCVYDTDADQFSDMSASEYVIQYYPEDETQ